MALVRYVLGKFLGLFAIAFPRFLDVPTFHHQVPPRPPRRERSQRRKWELRARMLSGNFAEMTTSTPFRDLLHAANLRHGTDGFTSLPKEGVLRIFSPLKIRRLQPDLNPRTWVLKASTLPLDHRSRFNILHCYQFIWCWWYIVCCVEWFTVDSLENYPKWGWNMSC